MLYATRYFLSFAKGRARSWLRPAAVTGIHVSYLFPGGAKNVPVKNSMQWPQTDAGSYPDSAPPLGINAW